MSGNRVRRPRRARDRCDRCLGRGARKRDSPRSRAPTRSSRAAAPTSSSVAIACPAQGGLTLRIPGRVVFIIPWPGHWIIGTTDHADSRPPERVARRPRRTWTSSSRPSTAQLDIDLSGAATSWARTPGCGRSSAIPAGRPSRPRGEHRVAADASGLVRISGGKYTTYRVMARDVVDASLGRTEARRRRVRQRPTCRSSGAAPRSELEQIGASLERPLRDAAAARGETDATWPARDRRAPRRSLRTRGDRRDGAGSRARPRGAAGPRASTTSRPRSRGRPAASSRSRLDDVLARRMRLAQELPDRGASIAPRVAAVLGAELGWDEARQAARGRAVSRDRAARVRPAVGDLSHRATCAGAAPESRGRRRLILALDQGTTSSRAIAFGRDGRPVARRSRPSSSGFRRPAT